MNSILQSKSIISKVSRFFYIKHETIVIPKPSIVLVNYKLFKQT